MYIQTSDTYGHAHTHIESPTNQKAARGFVSPNPYIASSPTQSNLHLALVLMDTENI